MEPTETTSPWHGVNYTDYENYTDNTTQIAPPWDDQSDITENQTRTNRRYGGIHPQLQMHDWRGLHGTTGTAHAHAAMDTGTEESSNDFDYHSDGYRNSSVTLTPDSHSRFNTTRLHKIKRCLLKRGESDTSLYEINNTSAGVESDESNRYDNVKFTKSKTPELNANMLAKSGKLASTGKEVKRSWPEPREKGERRVVAANYSAVEIHGFFGLIDDGSVGEGRMLIVHVPKWIRGYFLDIKQGDTLHVYHAKGSKIGGALTVLSTGRHQYYAPGRRVTTCTVCVPEEQWAPFT